MLHPRAAKMHMSHFSKSYLKCVSIHVNVEDAKLTGKFFSKNKFVTHQLLLRKREDWLLYNHFSSYRKVSTLGGSQLGALIKSLIKLIHT